MSTATAAVRPVWGEHQTMTEKTGDNYITNHATTYEVASSSFFFCFFFFFSVNNSLQTAFDDQVLETSCTSGKSISCWHIQHKHKQLSATRGASKYMHPVYSNRRINFAQTSLKHYIMLVLQNQYNAGSEQ